MACSSSFGSTLRGCPVSVSLCQKNIFVSIHSSASMEETCIADTSCHMCGKQMPQHISSIPQAANRTLPVAHELDGDLQGHATFVSYRNVVFIVCPHVHVHRSSHGAPLMFVVHYINNSFNTIGHCLHVHFLSPKQVQNINSNAGSCNFRGPGRACLQWYRSDADCDPIFHVDGFDHNTTTAASVFLCAAVPTAT